MAKEDNLIPFNKLTKEEQRIIAKKGAIKSIEVRKKQKNTKEILKCLLQVDAPPDLKDKLQKEFPGIDIKKIADLMNLSMIRKAISGNTKAYNSVIDRLEGKPKQKIKHEGEPTPKETLDEITKEANRTKNDIKPT